ncbi:D-glycero-beta-D-manno-heptose 1-phosphate adenylyltransferase [Nocardiopsis alba]|uniref:D-glycero-beta-D-manno-heptose 1-phosphate adenylyltransferase n=1 Tax=Nocardiopsis alba TaxID=53437 RepID=UPI00339E0D45
MNRGTVVVVGDALLDVDLRGESRRSCPDVPAPVLEHMTRSHRPGGAALTARLLSGEEGVDVVLLTALGEDGAAEEVVRGLGAGVEVASLVVRERTPCKTRIRACGTTVARVDEGCEPTIGCSEDIDVRSLLEGASAVLVSDYGLGVTGRSEVREAVAAVLGRVPVVWDPHPKGSPPVPGVDLVTPNEAESFVAGPEEGTARARARRLVDRWRAYAVGITLGERGAVWADARGGHGRSRCEVVDSPGDTCGAGDAFAAACTAALLSSTGIGGAVEAGTRVAADFVARGAAGAHTFPDRRRRPAVGLFTPSPVTGNARRRGERIVATGGCFDVLHAGHVDLLHRARALGDHLVVLVNDDASVRALKGDDRPVVPGHDRARILSALECVDTVVLFDELTPTRLLEEIRPDVWVKGGDHDPETLPETPVVRAGGGEVVTVPLLVGRSTTHVIDHIRGRVDASTL